MGAYGDLANDFEDLGVRLVALTSEGAEAAEAMADDEDLPFPVLHSVGLEEAEERLGLWIRRNEKEHLQPAQFVLRPDGTVHRSCYQSGPRGRLDADEALDTVRSSISG